MNSRSFHFTGIAGSGMNPLAQAARHCGHRVTGSDRYFDSGAPLPVISKLQKQGIRFFPQDGSGITPETDTLIVSTAVESDNPDLLEAKRLGIPVLHRAELLEQLCRGKTVIAVAGTAGKTTVTAMLGFIAEQLGLDPAVYTGAPLIDWRSDSATGNFRGGKSDLWIIETDESDRSFLRFHPEHSIVTNISKDHFELDELHSMFNRFRSQTRGSIIEGETRAPYSGELSMPGRHNRLNAACALALADALGWNRQQAEAALKNFQGIERRREGPGS